MFKKLLTISTTLVLLSSCGEHAERPEPLKRGDKNLSCSDVQLEINEADQYKRMAGEKKRLGIKSIVMPLGYIDTFMSADEAIQAADARIQYLNRIYDIKKCDPLTAEGPNSDEINNNIQRALQQPQYQQPQAPQGQPVGYTQPSAGNPYGQPIYYQQPRY